MPLTEEFSMGYPENIRAANRRYRERRERMHPLHRAMRDVATTTAITLATLAFWAVMLAPIILPLFH
jgi:aryl-alcohol dehydrogenase-like predicted oxidoreductase